MQIHLLQNHQSKRHFLRYAQLCIWCTFLSADRLFDHSKFSPAISQYGPIMNHWWCRWGGGRERYTGRQLHQDVPWGRARIPAAHAGHWFLWACWRGRPSRSGRQEICAQCNSSPSTLTSFCPNCLVILRAELAVLPACPFVKNSSINLHSASPPPNHTHVWGDGTQSLEETWHDAISWSKRQILGCLYRW